MLDAWMNEIARELALGDAFANNPTGVYTFPLEEDVTITITPVPQGVTFSCTVAPCPQTNRESFFTQALLGNLFGQGTRGGVLGLTEDGNRLTLTRVVENIPEYKGFREALEDFITAVDFWRSEATAKT